jgi:hypothetical protein
MFRPSVDPVHHAVGLPGELHAVRPRQSGIAGEAVPDRFPLFVRQLPFLDLETCRCRT